MSQSRWLGALLAGALGMGVLAGTPVAFADGMRGGKTVGVVDRPFSWTGFYIGGHAGIATGDTQDDPNLPIGPSNLLSTDFTMNGALYGGQIGYNWQMGLLVLGIEGSLSGSSIQGNSACVAILECKRDIDWLATVTGRVGYAMGRTLLYGMAGVAWADVNTDVSIVGVPILSGGDTHTGWIVGFGFEQALSQHISVRVEYAHIDLGNAGHGLSGVGPLAGIGTVLNDSVDLKLDTIRLGVNVKLF
jgi:outer membrane immunogenic protein